jgi:hypothetical protein
MYPRTVDSPDILNLKPSFIDERSQQLRMSKIGQNVIGLGAPTADMIQ